MQIFAVMMVRNEADILRVNLLHHLALGVDRFLIVDNGSCDGTDRILEELSRDKRIRWRRDPGPYRQSEITTLLAREAFREGAGWVIPIDADEFWYAPGGDFRGVLEKSPAGALQVEVLNFIQRREQRQAAPDALLHMTRRVPLPVGPLECVQELVQTRQFAYVEMMYSPKFVSRPTARIEIAMGNHGVTGVQGPVEATDEILCLHAVLRSRSALEAKVEQGARVEELGLGPLQGWHVRRWRRLAEAGELEDEWLANSYSNDCLDVNGVPRQVAFDPRLRDVVAPWVNLPSQSGLPIRNEEKEQERAALLRTIQQQLNIHRREKKLLEETSRQQVGERDRIIRDLQAELFAKVGERDKTIRELQAELHEKVAECNRIIRSLQERLRAR